jgi:hypothetical protein
MDMSENKVKCWQCDKEIKRTLYFIKLQKIINFDRIIINQLYDKKASLCSKRCLKKYIEELDKS